ncbi:MAG: endo-1,4-beta-xylanase [Gemmatimonadota bacterium]|nr:endo-1,4-beta-xylanase [Gemmatimonadota bacterium]
MRPMLFRALLLVALLSIVPAAGAGVGAQQADPRFFAETGFRISNDQFWDYFQKRGGVRTFGFPASRDVTLQGFVVQFFQRGIMQAGPNGVQTLNLLDEGLMPYTTINGSTFPAPDPAVVKETPDSSDPGYSAKVIEFARQMAPDNWEGQPVNFFKTFSSTVTFQDAFPGGDGPASLLPLINLEIWGAPTSKPTRDPNNDNFVYLRFQRGIMHYDKGCGCTQGLLLADYLKALLTGENLPADLEAQAAGSPFYKQYRRSGDGVDRSKELPNTNLKDGFEKQTAGQASAAATPRPTQTETTSAQAQPTPRATPKPVTSKEPYRAQSPEYGMNVFLWGHASTTDRDLRKLSDAGFTWQKSLFQWRLIEPAKGQFDWSEADRIVEASKRSGIKTIARLDFQPAWARAAPALNGPPDNYQDFANFVRAFVSRYGSDSQIGQVPAIEVWNEPNLAREWGDQPVSKAQAADYVRLLKVSYEAAKGADPSVVVITGGLSPTGTDNNEARPDDLYVQWMYDAGAKPYFDVLGAHGAGYKAPPSVSPEEAASTQLYGGHRFFTFRRVEDLRRVMVENGDADKQIWLLEFGWTSDTVHAAYAWHQVSEEQKAEYLVGAYQWAARNWAPWVGVMTLWNLPDPNWGPDREEYWWSVANPDGTTRIAYDRLLKARKDKVLP